MRAARREVLPRIRGTLGGTVRTTIFLACILILGCGQKPGSAEPLATQRRRPTGESLENAFAKRAQSLRQDEAHSARCRTIFDDFRRHARIGMSSEQLAAAVEMEWIKKAHVYPILVLAGWIPLEMDSSSICYCAHLYPNADNWSDHVIYFRISDPRRSWRQGYAAVGKQFLQGALKDPSVKLREFALCHPGKTSQGIRLIERFPKRAESE